MQVDQTLPLPDQEARERILTALDSNMLVEAAAGTGKTTSMVRRMVELLRTGRCKVGAIAAVTFTRKAAAELRGRFQIELEQAVANSDSSEKVNLQDALANVERCFIGTIHSFCSRLLRERPVEAEVSVSFQELDEETEARLREEAWENYTSSLIIENSDNTIRQLETLGLHYEELKDSFLRFVNYSDVDSWPVRGDNPPLQLKPVAEKVSQYLAQMKKLAPDLPGDSGNDTLIPKYLGLPRVLHFYNLDNPVQLMEFLEKFSRVNIIQGKWPNGKDQAKAEKERWDTFRDEVVTKTLDWWYESRYSIIKEYFLQARKVFDRLRDERGLLNYQDLLLKASKLLRDKPHVRAYFRRRFSHLLVDEFQDTDPIQAEVMMFLTAEDEQETDWRKCSPRPGSLFVVGDPKQSIYRFRRADIMTYNEVRDIIAKKSADGAAGEIVQLSCNFRSSEPIISWVNQTFASRFPVSATDESPAYVSLQPGKRESASPAGLSGIYTLQMPGEVCNNKIIGVEYEADFIARTIRKALDSKSSPPASPQDFMIVTKGRKNLSAFARRLQAYNIPHQVTGGTSLNEVCELKMLHTCLKAVLEPDNPVALVTLLRSEVFGLSDALLYKYKKAGGLFLYGEKLPEEITEGPVKTINEIFSRLQKYSRWLVALPPIAAIEEISADLGLVALAGSHEGGDLEAGGFGKAIELLRAAQKQTYSVSQLVELLERIVEKGEKFDSISALSEDKPVVRIMNLHKVKGLEAPIVFLADANGEATHKVGTHIDRSGNTSTGYMAIRNSISGSSSSKLLAQPPGWDELSLKEKAFLDAEKLRLHYVAATRAGRALIITQKEKWNNRNPWHFFQPELSNSEELPDPGPQSSLRPPGETFPSGSVEDAARNISARLRQVVIPTYRVHAAREYAIENMEARGEIIGVSTVAEIDEPSREIIQGEAAGSEWGSVIHALLEVAMENPGVDLMPFAKIFLEKNGLNLNSANAAMATVRSIMKSEIWKRAQASTECFTEAPFHILQGEGSAQSKQLPILVNGVIDLVFKENGGWVIVDYKTDSLEKKQINALAKQYAPQLFLYAKAWEECTGEGVLETGLYFTRADKFVQINRG